MSVPVESYGLDLHCTMILEEYRDAKPVFEKMRGIVEDALKGVVSKNGVVINALESRIKTEKSLVGKLELKGSKYNFLSDLTDILGLRVITFYTDDVDKIAAMIDKLFVIDWDNSVDKRKMHEIDSFGYNSLHYICSIPKSLYNDPACPQINEFRFEIQMRTCLQHMWATMHHDTGYKSGVEIPREFLRNMNRLAGMLELADEQFSMIRTQINDYRRKVQGLVSNGKFEEVPLNADTFRSYLKLEPFEKLNRRIAAINQAEINTDTMMPYFNVLKELGFKTLGDVEKLKKDYTEDAYIMAVFQLGNTDLDIISSTVALQDLLIVYIMENNGGVEGLTGMFDTLNGQSAYNAERAARLMENTKNLPFRQNNEKHG